MVPFESLLKLIPKKDLTPTSLVSLNYFDRFINNASIVSLSLDNIQQSSTQKITIQLFLTKIHGSTLFCLKPSSLTNFLLLDEFHIYFSSTSENMFHFCLHRLNENLLANEDKIHFKFVLEINLEHNQSVLISMQPYQPSY